MAFTRPASNTQQLSYGQVEQLWINAGGSAALAPLMAAIAKAESGLNTQSLNDDPSTGDYSVGLWQINYFNGMRAGRTQQFGSPEQLLADPNLQARAAVAIYREQGLGAWSTYTSGAYRPYLNGSVPPDANIPPGVQNASSVQQVESGQGNCQISVLGVCVLTKQQSRQLLGVLTIGAGGVVGLVGVLILVGYGLARTRAIEAATNVVPSPILKAAKAGRSAAAATDRANARTRQRAAKKAAAPRRAPAQRSPLAQPIRSGGKPAAKKAAPKEQRRKQEDSGLYEGGE